VYTNRISYVCYDAAVDKTEISFVCRDGRTIHGTLALAERKKGFAVLIHGLGGYKEQEHLVEAAAVLSDCGFSTLVVDATDDIAHGKEAVMGATPTKRIENLKDAVHYALSQDWGKGDCIVGGHSLGGLAAGIVAASGKFPISGAILLAPVVSGDIQWFKRGLTLLKLWQKMGTMDREFVTRKTEIFKLGYALGDDARHYSLLREADRLRAFPVLMLVGEHDAATPSEELALLAHAIGESGTYVEIPDTKHNFRGKEKEVGVAIASWLASEF
jgi:alpha-beta hydrolase superfamily lysophospholipase